MMSWKSWIFKDTLEERLKRKLQKEIYNTIISTLINSTFISNKRWKNQDANILESSPWPYNCNSPMYLEQVFLPNLQLWTISYYKAYSL
uniref:Uncharacterized protein n=1 Tax=Glossina morsitans morsitans TaxID=37546 RepID=A0ABK9NG09_GLOMM